VPGASNNGKDHHNNSAKLRHPDPAREVLVTQPPRRSSVENQNRRASDQDTSGRAATGAWTGTTYVLGAARHYVLRPPRPATVWGGRPWMRRPAAGLCSRALAIKKGRCLPVIRSSLGPSHQQEPSRRSMATTIVAHPDSLTKRAAYRS